MYEKSVFISDIHIPYESKPAVKCMFNFIREFKPDNVFIVGDLTDMYNVSSFDKDPSRITSMQSDIDKTNRFLDKLQSIHTGQIMYIEGNHESRLKRYLWKHPELESLKSLAIESLFELKDRKIEYVGQYMTYKYHGFVIEHGSLVRQHSAYTARAMHDKRGMSGLSGHTHRLGIYYHTNMAGKFLWAENGCLCNTAPEYVIGVPDWMNGFSVGYFKGKRFNLEQIPIINGRAFHAGVEY